MTDMTDRYRLLVLGSGQVGKTSLIRRYLYDTFSDRYKETVEDIFSRDFRINGHVLPLDIYDTNYYYPDMRRVSIASANAFLFIFAVDNVNSFKDVTELFQEVADRRSAELAHLPIILVGNKSDATNKKIYPETVQVWLNRLNIKKTIPYLETSAKNNENLVEVFKRLLDQSGFPHQMVNTDSHGQTPQQMSLSPRRRSPNSRSTRSPARHKKIPPQLELGANDESLAPDTGGINETCDSPKSPKSPTSLNEQRISRLTRTLSRKEKPVTNLGVNGTGGLGGGGGGLTRHGSLMRKTQRLSLKLKHAAPDELDESDCKIS